MIGIYKIENKINGHCYIGQSIDIERRWKQEIQGAFCETDREYNYPLSRALRKYGVDNFSFTVLCECQPEDLNQLEEDYVRTYNSYFNGYNQTMGGDHTAAVAKELVIQIQQELPSTTEPWTVLSKRYQISDDTISKINRGLAWFNPQLSYPLRPVRPIQATATINPKPVVITWSQDMAKDIYDLGWTHAAPKYGISDSGLRKRAMRNGWPDTIFEFRNKYRQEVLELPPVAKKEKKEKPIIQQYDKNMQLIAEYDTPSNASRAVLGDESGGSHITQCCMGKRKTAYKFIWRYKE